MSDIEAKTGSPEPEIEISPGGEEADIQVEKPRAKRPRTVAQLEALRKGREKRAQIAAERKQTKKVDQQKSKIDKAKEKVRRLMESAVPVSELSSDSESETEVDAVSRPNKKQVRKSRRPPPESGSESDGSSTDESQHGEVPNHRNTRNVVPSRTIMFI